MTTCVNPMNTIPTNYPCGAPSAGPVNFPGTPNFGSQQQFFPGYANTQFPTGANYPWPTNTNGYGYGYPATNVAPPQWTNSYGYPVAGFNTFSPNTFPGAWSTSPFTGGFPTPCTAQYPTQWNAFPFNNWQAPSTNPFTAFQPGTFQSPWNWNSNPPFFNTTPSAPFVNNYPTPYTPAFTTPFANTWPNVTAAINTLCQPTNWSSFGTTSFNTTPWTNGFPTFGNTYPTQPTPVGFTPAFNNGFNTPTPGFNPTFAFNAYGTNFPTPFGFAQSPTNTGWTPWTGQTPSFGGYIPGMVNPNTHGFTPPYTNGVTPPYSNGYAQATPTTGIPTTRTNIQNGDGSYRNAA